jgi:hypothetical protein
MVTEALMGVLGGLVHAVIGSLPTVPVPDWLSAGSAGVSTIAGYGSGLGVWLPVSLIITVLGALIAAWLTGFVIKVARIVASFLTLGGGSAA